MDVRELSVILRGDKVVCVIDDFYEVAVKFIPDGDSCSVEIKHRHRQPVPISSKDDSVWSTVMNGEIVDEEEYDEY
jgi:signal transduction histidine kinase